ncbi:hypothetical protein QSJ19_00985 [Gordonia sp. ABSL11-1]|uniref:hypothetical protein n=1 Tax=Gordonia sp. ABSL11-1 TaxID=3053924 RepID=UPI0025731653|nr:hypothetical protein [Gordonia sp. ABSL11-1]MDL9944176.1 hypothetical protein [Gordonia sp. ABSL11-1]
MRQRIPTDDEIRTVAEASGLIEAGAPITPYARRKAAKAIESSAAEVATEQAAEQATASLSSVATEIRTLYSELTRDGGLTDTAAGPVLAALAPHIWRTSTERKAATS